MKTECILEGNLRNLFDVLMSLCDTKTENQVERSAEYKELKTSLYSMGLLAIIKKLVYMGGANNKHI